MYRNAFGVITQALDITSQIAWHDYFDQITAMPKRMINVQRLTLIFAAQRNEKLRVQFKKFTITVLGRHRLSLQF